MNTRTQTTSALPRSLLFAGLTAFALVAAMPHWNSAHAQSATAAVASRDDAARLHTDGLEMQRRKDDNGAFTAFMTAAAVGYAPSQQKLGEIYDRGNASVPRNYEQSIRWYKMAEDGGAYVPWLGSRMPGLSYGP